MNLRNTPKHFTLSSALFSAALLTSSPAAVTPGGTFTDQAIITEAAGGEVLVKAATAAGLGPVLVHDFDTGSTVEGSYELTAGKITLSSGRHLVMYDTRFDATAGLNRAEILSNLTLAGSPLAIGRSQGFIRRAGAADETVMSGGGIITVAADDDILTLESRRSDNNPSATAVNATRVANGTAIQLLKLDDSWDYLNVQRTTDQAGAIGTVFTDVIYDTDNSAATHGTAFSFTTGSGDITLKEGGLYLVFANTRLEKPVDAARTNYRQRLTLNGAEVAGAQTTTYIRGSGNGENGHSGVASVGTLLTATAGQVLNVELRKDGGTSSTIKGNETALTIVKLPLTAKAVSLVHGASQEVNNLAVTPMIFDTLSSGSSAFSHTLGGSTVTVNADDDYLFFGSIFTDGGVTNEDQDRTVALHGWQIDGTGGPINRGRGAAYNRDSAGGKFSGSWGGLISAMTNGQTIELTSQRLGNSDLGTINTVTLQGLSVSSLIPSNDPALAINLPITVIPNSTGNVITAAFLDTFDNDTAPAGLTYTIDTAPTGGTLNLSGGALGMGGTFTQDDVDNGLVTFDAGAAAPIVGGFDFTVSDGSASDNSTFVINVKFPTSIVSIADDGDVVEGATSDFIVTTDVAPVGANLTVTVAYSGSADGSDFTGSTTVDILDGATSATLNVSTIADGLFEGTESVTATITDVSGAMSTGEIGTPSAATFLIIDGANAAPIGTSLSQVISGTGTLAIGDIIVTDPDASYDSTVTTAGTASFHTNGIANLTIFSDGRADDDSSFDLDASGPAVSQPAGFSVEIAFIPQADDLTGVVDVWEIGGASNGSAILLIEGVPHLLSKAGGGPGDVPTDDASVAGAFTDLDWATDDTIVVPLNGATALVAGQPARLAMVYNITGNTVKSSVNGSAEATANLLNNDAGNWVGDHTVNTGTGAGSGTGASSNVAGLAFDATLKNLSNGFSSTSSVRFWNESSGSTTWTAGTAESITATLTISDWTSSANGTLTATSGNGETFAAGVWSVTGDTVAVNAALAAAEFVTGGSTANPTLIAVSIEDGDEDAGGPVTGTIVVTPVAADPIYVDDDFSGSIGDSIADADGGAPVSSALFGISAFSSLADALGAVTPTGTIIINDGDYSTENVTLTDTVTLQLTDTTGPVQIGNLGSGETNSIVLQGSNTLEVGALNLSAPGVDSAISGTGNITKVGTGVFVVRQVNTYTGTTTVLDGMFRVGQNNTLALQSELAGDGPVVVTDPGRFELNVDVDKTINQTGVISGTGSVGILGDGTVIFDGPANTFSGGFEFGDGGGSTWDGAIGAKGGFVVVNDNGHLGTGPIHSRGAQFQAGTPGIVIPNDINVNAGGFRSGGAIDFEFGGNITTINNDPRGFGNYGLEGLDLTISGNIIMGAPTGIVYFEGSNGKDNGSWTVTGDVSGGALLATQVTFDDGLLTLTGNLTHTGNTNWRVGTVVFNATETGGGTLTVDAAATMEGTGSTTSAVIVNGTLSPGVNSIGTMSTGPLTLNGTLAVDVDNTAGAAGTDWDQVVVTGTVTIGATASGLTPQSATVEASPADIVIISNDDVDTVTGTFALPFAGDYLGSGLSANAGYTGGDANDVILTTGTAGIIGSWRATNFASSANTGNGENLSDAGDSDGLTNLLEFAFGTDPNDADQANLVIDGSVNGVPIVNTDFSGAGVAFDAVFVRRDDFGASGSLNYTPQFSSDLATWENSTTTPTLVADSTDDSAYEVVSVPYPFFTSDGKKARFFRVLITLVP
ncbi:MAG: cadherin-like domain-containing protein [Akkermansiaceae bacterium]